MSHRRIHDHPSAEDLQALLDGELPREAAVPVEEHLASCARCASDAEALGLLFREIEALPRLVPLEGFAERVIQHVAAPEPRSLAARIRERLSDLAPGAGRHPEPGRLQDFVEGVLATGTAARVARHVERCSACAREATDWADVLERLDRLGHLAPAEEFADHVMATLALQRHLGALGHLTPSAGFAARVMAEVRVPTPVAVPAIAPAPTPAWGRLLAAARRLVPETRQAWAAVSGVAVTPLVTVGLMLYVLVGHPTLTAGALVSFGWWKVTDLAALAWAGISTAAIESAGTFRLFTAMQAIADSPAMLVAGFLVFSVCTISALWVVYRYLIANPPVDRRYAHASF